MLKKVTINSVTPNTSPKFVKTQALTYTREGSPEKTWEMIIQHDSVHILVNKVDSKELLLVKQIRPPVLHKYPSSKGVVIEACAGIIDKYPDLHENPEIRAALIAEEEVHEELGYKIPDTAVLRSLPPYLSSVGTAGNMCYPFYCEVTDSMFVGQQLESSEDIEVLHIPHDNIKSMLTINHTDATTRYLLQWFLINKA